MKWLQILFRMVMGIMGLVVLYFVLAIALSIIRVQQPLEVHDADSIEIFLRTNGVHADLVFPVESGAINWSDWVKYEHTLLANSDMNWIAFGWGHREFYLNTPNWRDLKIGVAFNAAFGLGEALIRTRYLHRPETNAQTVKLTISRAAYSKLVEHVHWHLKVEEEALMLIPGAYGHYDAFYEAKGRYHLFYTCNTWVNHALKTAGQKACLWTPFDKGIFYHY